MSDKKVESVADDSMICAAKEFLTAKATQSDNNIFAVRGSDIKKFMKEQGIPMDLQHRIDAIQDSLLAAAIDYTGEKLIEVIQTKKAAGESAEDVPVTMNLNYHNGRTQVIMDPHVARKIPTHLPSMQGRAVEGDGFTHHYGAITVKKNCKTILNTRTEQLASWETKIKAELGL